LYNTRTQLLFIVIKSYTIILLNNNYKTTTKWKIVDENTLG
jgi:hypothetical protein